MKFGTVESIVTPHVGFRLIRPTLIADFIIDITALMLVRCNSRQCSETRLHVVPAITFTYIEYARRAAVQQAH